MNEPIRLLRILSGALLVLAVGLPPSAHAQSARLNGFISDAETGDQMELVNVVATSPEGDVVEGAVTNSDGAYVIPRLAAARWIVQASFVGYHTFRDTLDLAADEVRILNIALEPDAAALDEVVVQGAGPGGLTRVTAGQQTVRPAEIELVPSPDLSADLASYLQTLPGVVTMGDRGGQFFIRGGEPTQNLVLLDGMPVYQPFHVLGFYSTFPADMLQRADVHAGGFGARYGGRLSSVIDITSRNGNNTSYEGAVSVSPFVSTVQVEGPLLPRRASMLVSVRQSFLEQGAEQYMDTPMPYKFGDVLAKIHAAPSSTTRLSVTGLNTYDRGVLAELADDPAREELRWQNQALGARLVSLPQVVPFVGDLTVSYSRLHSGIGPSGRTLRSSEVQEWRASAVGTFYHGRLVDTEAGLEYVLVLLDNNLGGLFQEVVLEEERLENIAFFIEPEITPGWGFRVRPGLRFHMYRLDPYPRPEPRLRIIWERGVHHVSAAAGLYHQELVGASDRRDAASVFTAWTLIRGAGGRPSDIDAGRLGRAVHTLLGYRTTPLQGFDVSIEGFYKKLSDIFVPEWTSYPRLTTDLQATDGRSFGVDARMSYRHGRLQAHLGYGYSNTEYEASRPRYEIWYGDETLRVRPSHDRRHQVNALLSASVRGFDVSASWHFGSGMPFSQASGFGGFILMHWPDLDVADQGTQRVIYERPNNGVLPTFHRLDVSVERSFRLGAADLALQASAINLYDRRNLFYLDVFTHQRADQLPFVPSVGLKLSFR